MLCQNSQSESYNIYENKADISPYFVYCYNKQCAVQRRWYSNTLKKKKLLVKWHMAHDIKRRTSEKCQINICS